MNFIDGQPQPKPKKTVNKLVITLLVLLLLASVGAAAFFYLQWAKYKNNPNKVSEDDLQQTIDEIGQLIVLPTGEKPTVATVSDPEKLKDQPFFAHAKTGDKVLFYQNARKAYLYDPVARKLIDVSTIANSANQTPPSTVSGSNTQTITPQQ